MTIFVYLAVIVGIVVGALGIIRGHDNGIRAEESEKWKPQLAACKFNEDAAVVANSTLQGNLATLKTTLAEQENGIHELTARTDVVTARTQALMTQANQQREGLQRELAGLRKRQAATVGTDHNLTCEQNLSLVKDALNEAVDARIRWTLSLPATTTTPAPAPGSMTVTEPRTLRRKDRK